MKTKMPLKNLSFTPLHSSALLLSLLLGLSVGARDAQAATTYTWNGGGTDTNWSTSGNWASSTVPLSNANSAVFISAAGTSNVDSAWTLQSLTISAGSDVLTGSALSFSSISSGATTTVVINSGGTGANTINNNIYLGDTNSNTGAWERFLFATALNLYGNVTTAGSGASTRLQFAGSGARNIYGNITLTTSGTLLLRDSSTTNIYSTGNTVGTVTTWSGANIVMQAANAFSASTSLNNGGNINLNGHDQTFGGFIAATGTISSTTAANFTVNSSVDSTYGGIFTGAVTLTKSGAATLELTGVNTNTGAAAVNAGTLKVNGSLAAGSAVTVASGATLSGTGIVNGSANIQGTLAAGNGVGTLKTGALTLASTAILDVELGRNGTTATSDLTNVTGTVDIDSGADLKLTLATGLTNLVMGDIVILIANDGTDAVNGAFTSLNGTPTTWLTEGKTFQWNNQDWEITYKADSATSSFTGGNDVALMVVPEPSTWAMLMGGIGMLAFGQRLRSRRS